MFDIEENLKQLPSSPGVYLHKDAYGEVIYVGKASSLRNRVRQYFRAGGRDDKTEALASHIACFEYIVTNTEAEALLLENTLIKRHRPRYNVMLRDDKTYPYIKITMGERWPRLLKTRILAADGSKYFGPYADVGAVNRIIALLNDVYRLKRCARPTFPRNHRQCLHGHIDRCRRICSRSGPDAEVLHDEYMEDIGRITSFLKGNSAEVERYITQRMNEASERMDYEEAARWRDYLSSARAVTEKQRVELLSSGSMDVALASPGAAGDETSGVTVFFVRDGKLVGRERHLVDVTSGAKAGGVTPGAAQASAASQHGASRADVVAAFISQYYANQSSPPREILIEEHIPDEQLIADALSESGGYRVSIRVPLRGAKKELLRLAKNDVSEAARRETRRAEAEAKKRGRLTAQLTELFGEGRVPSRIEAYDISHTGGANSVGAMVVFVDGKPSRSDYRRFKIRGETGGDDYAAMQEVLYRRLNRALSGDKGFLPLPDLILIDGGKGHVTAALQVMNALGDAATPETGSGDEVYAPALVRDVLVAGMVKDDKHRTRALVMPKSQCPPSDADSSDGEVDAAAAESEGDSGAYAETELKGRQEVFHLTGLIQEEAHRFALDYHRKRRGKGMLE